MSKKCHQHGVNFTEECPFCQLDGTDPVNHPKHYTAHPSGIECIQVTEHFDFVVGNIIKYAWRAGLKEGSSRQQDLEKCLWYARRAVDREIKKMGG